MRMNTAVVVSFVAFFGIASTGPFSGAARAAEEVPADVLAGSDEPQEQSSVLPQSEVKVGGTVVGDSVGGATGFVFKRGFYTQSDLGAFFRLGGYNINQSCESDLPCEAVATSNLQPFIGLSAGYDLLSWLGIQASFGTGFVTNAAPYGNRSPTTPRDYGMTFLNLGVVGSFYLPAPVDRLAIAGKLSGGGLFLTPEPDVNEPFAGGNISAGLGLRYATLLPDTFVGFDFNSHYILVPDSAGGIVPAAIGGADFPGIIAFSFAPVIKYVF